MFIVLRATFLATFASIATAAEPPWSLVSLEDAASYEQVSSLQQESANTIPDEYGKTAIHPVFEFRCVPGRDSGVYFIIDWRRFISSFNTEVGFRVDGGKALWLMLGVDRTNKLTLSKTAADVERLIGRFGEGEIVEVEVAPYSEAAVFVRFDISTFDAGLEMLRKSCR